MIKESEDLITSLWLFGLNISSLLLGRCNVSVWKNRPGFVMADKGYFAVWFEDSGTWIGNSEKMVGYSSIGLEY